LWSERDPVTSIVSRDAEDLYCWYACPGNTTVVCGTPTLDHLGTCRVVRGADAFMSLGLRVAVGG
jgi:hypothetical protein